MLKRLMQRALQTVHVVRGIVPLSSNYASTSAVIFSTRKTGRKIETKADLLEDKKEDKKASPLYVGAQYQIGHVRDKIREDAPYWEPGRANPGWSSIGWWKFARAVSETCRELGVGNCGELAVCACDCLCGNGGGPADYIEISTVDIAEGRRGATPVLPHCICVIGRTQGSNTDFTPLSMPDEWGPTAVVCDPWDRAAYPAVDFAKFWGGIYAAANGSAITCKLIHRFV